MNERPVASDVDGYLFWRYDEDGNAVVFEPLEAPPRVAEILVRYGIRCDA